MKNEIMGKLSLVMIVFIMLLLVIMNIGVFTVMTLYILRALLAVSLIVTGVLIHKSQIV